MKNVSAKLNLLTINMRVRLRNNSVVDARTLRQARIHVHFSVAVLHEHMVYTSQRSRFL